MLPEADIRVRTGVPQYLLSAIGLLIAFRVLSLGLYPLSDNTESRYAEIARRMVASGDWITLRISDNAVFWGKPPLSSWLSAAGIQLFGTNEWAARVPSALLALGISYLVWSWARPHSLRWASFAMAVLWGSGAFFVAAGAVMTDMALLIAVMLAMYGFWHAQIAIESRRKRRLNYLFFVGLGLGMLAKGPVALLLIGVPIVVWAIMTRSVRQVLCSMSWVAGLSIALAICLPWYALAELKTPGFLEYFLVGEHWRRFTQPGWSGDLYGTAHVQPRGTIWLYMLAGMMPWTLMLAGLAMHRRRRDPSPKGGLPMARTEGIFLLLWALAPGAVFTLAGNILWTYILPAVPAVALGVGRYFANDPRQRLVDRLAFWGVCITGALFAGILFVQGSYGGFNSAKAVVHAYELAHPERRTLLFVGRSAYSPLFYTDGQSQTVVDGDALSRWVRDRANAEGVSQLQLHLAVHSKDWNRPSDQLPLVMHVEGRYGDYLLVSTTWDLDGRGSGRTPELHAPELPPTRELARSSVGA